MKKYLFGSVAGGATLLITGFIIYIIIFQDSPTFIYGEGADACTRELIFPVIALMELFYGLLLTMIFSKWASISTFKGGLSAGGWIGVLIGLTFGMWMFATTTLINAGGIAYYAITIGVRFALAGGVVGWVLGKVRE